MKEKRPDPIDSPVDSRLSNGGPPNASPDGSVESVASGSSWLKKFIPRSESRFVFLFAMYCYAVALGGISSQLLVLGRFWEMRIDPEDNTARYVQPGLDDSTLVEVLLVAPVSESLIMIGIIELLRRFGFRAAIQLAASVSVSCLLHGVQYRFYAFSVAPAMFILAGTYIYWRHTSFWVGLQMIVLLHFALNCLPALSVIVQQFLS